MKVLSISVVTCLALIVLAVPTWANEQEQDSIQSSSRKAYIDESTGELTSTPPPATAALLSQKAASADNTQEIEYITHPDGTVDGKLNGHFQSRMTATVTSDGVITQDHNDEAPMTPTKKPHEGSE